jgi:hypothetical protein
MDGTEDYLPLWLELHLDEQAWLFELGAREERAVVVGSHPTSDVRVARAGVASTHFHFERESGSVVVVPGFRAALVIDHAPATEPTFLGRRARVEFCGTVLEATVHDVPPLHMLLQARHGTDLMMRRPDYIERLPEATDPTVVAIAAVGAPQAPTSEAGGTDSDEELDTMTTTAWRASPSAKAIGPQGTVIMQRPPGPDTAPATSEPRRSSSLPPIAPAERIRLDPWGTLPNTGPDSSPTRVEVPRPRRSRTPPSLGAEGAARSSRPSMSTNAPSLAPIERAVSPWPASALARLGLAASRHPIRVAMAALPICAVLALACVGAARLAGRYPAARPARPLAAVATSATEQTGHAQPRAAAATSAASATASLTSVEPPLSLSSSSAAAPAAGATTVSARPAPQRSPRPPKHVFLGK